MKYTVGQYIKKHPRSMLAKRLKKYSPRKRILEIGSGTISDDPRSNLGRALKRRHKTMKSVVVGGRAGQSRNDGYWWAILS